MKKIILLLVFAPLFMKAVHVIPKDKYAHGQIFLLNNDTLSVYVKIENISDLQNGIQYVDTTGKELTLKPENSRGFILVYPNDTMFFESRNDMGSALFQSKKKNYSFVHRVFSGKLPLYFFIEIKLVMDGMDQVEQERPRYFVRFRGEWYPITKENFKNDGRKLLSLLKREGYNTKNLNSKLDADLYKFEDTPIFIGECAELFLTKVLQTSYH